MVYIKIPYKVSEHISFCRMKNANKVLCRMECVKIPYYILSNGYNKVS
jgi:hypothetical protein